MKNLWKKIAETSGARIYAYLAGVVTLVLTARLLGPEGRGTVAAVNSWVGLFSTFSYLSLGQVALYRASQAEGEEWYSKTFGALVFLATGLTILAGSVATATYLFSSGRVFGSVPALILFTGFLMLPLQIWEQYSSSLLMAINHLQVYNIAQVIGRTAGVVGIVAFVGLFRWGVLGSIIGNVLAQAVVALAGAGILWRFAGKRFVLDTAEVVYLLKSGAKLHLNAVGTFLFSQSNILLLNYYASKAEVGWYQFSYQLLSVMLIIPQAASMVLYTRMGQIGPDKLWPDQKRLGLQVIILMALIATISYVSAPWMIPFIAGNGFQESIRIFQLLLPSVLGMTLSTLMANQWIGRGLFLQAALITAGCGLANLGLNYWLIPLYGMKGAIWATAATYLGIVATTNLLMAIWCERKAREKMGNWPKVSVAIITYNQKKYLRECIESVLTQDYPNLEIVVADDASTDGTQDLLREYEQKYPGLFKLILAEENEGITANSNRAFFACTGKYIAWMGGDDLMLPGKIKKQVVFMENRPDHAICYHDLEVFDSTTNKIIKKLNSGPNSLYPYEGGPEKIVKSGNCLGASSVMTRRSACPSSGFDPRIKIASDWLFWIETAINGKVGFIPEVLGRYRRHNNNITRKASLDLDKQLTLAIVEVKYPYLVKYTRLCRARYLYGLAVQKILSGNGKQARLFLLESIRQGWTSWKWIGWFLKSYL